MKIALSFLLLPGLACAQQTGLWPGDLGAEVAVRCPSVGDDVQALPANCPAPNPGMLLRLPKYTSLLDSIEQAEKDRDEYKDRLVKLSVAVRNLLKEDDVDPWVERGVFFGTGALLAGLATYALCHSGKCGWPSSLSF